MGRVLVLLLSMIMEFGDDDDQRADEDEIEVEELDEEDLNSPQSSAQLDKTADKGRKKRSKIWNQMICVTRRKK